jgi:putative CocE/NonD family hydrolase
LLVGVLAGCAGPKSPHAAPAPADAVPRCVHPWPCGDGSEWPAGLAGPFAIGSVEHVQVPSFDGVPLDGWLLHPDLPAGVRAPVVLTSGPYWGQGYPTPEDDTPPAPPLTGGGQPFQDFDLQGHFWELAQAGYAVAVFNVRGTGNSGGCFGFFSPEEQQDQVALVEWLAAQPWSNGRVAMMGYSYLGTTPLEAAVRAPPALKAIVVAGIIPDSYIRFATPQGAIYPGLVATDQDFAALNSIALPVAGEPTHPDYWAVQHASRLPGRACPEAQAFARTEAESVGADARPSAFWAERRLSAGFRNVTAAVLLGHGLHDPLQWEADTAWQDLAQAPKAQFFGQWGHQFPDSPDLDGRQPFPEWPEHVEAWLDFWLKGIGAAPADLGRVAYQDGGGTWRDDTAWPPSAVRSEVLYLAGDKVSPLPLAGSASFRSAPAPGGEVVQAVNFGQPSSGSVLCPPTSLAGTTAVFWSEPVREPVVIAGNPMAYLRLTSDAPGGVVALELYDVGPDFACTGAAPTGVRFLRSGAADLRFLHGNLAAEPFPVGAATSVRVDLSNLAEPLAAGHRLAVVAGGGSALGWSDAGQKDFPTVAVESTGDAQGSHLVLPLVAGTLGGSAPTLDYPPRPFQPR